MARIRFARVAPLLLLALGSCGPGNDHRSELPLEPARTELTGETAESITLVEGAVTELDPASAVIGVEGGSLSLAGHTLVVPTGAVSQPTLFTMAPLANGLIEVDLGAVRTTGHGELVDVGEEGFPPGRRVRLTLSYAGATGVDDPRRLLVVHRRDDGVLVPLDSRVDEASRTVAVELEHFSRYCIGMR